MLELFSWRYCGSCFFPSTNEEIGLSVGCLCVVRRLLAGVSMFRVAIHLMRNRFRLLFWCFDVPKKVGMLFRRGLRFVFVHVFLG